MKMNSFKIIKKAERETKLRARDAGEDDNTNFDLRPAATAGGTQQSWVAAQIE